MEAIAAYAWLMDGRDGPPHDIFEAHVLASVLSVAIAETSAGGLQLSEGTGLTATELTTMATVVFSHALPLLRCCDSACPGLTIPEDEQCLRDLLTRFTTHRTPFQLSLAALVARRSMRPNHLWQDLGLRNRDELSALMRRHFEPLARRNVNNMKWKKFLYRMICRDEGFRLCTAPSCAECDDFSACFGDETGESLLARSRRESELRLYPQPR